MGTLEDIKNVIAILETDMQYKETRIKELEAQGDTTQAELLKAELKGMREAITDIEQAL